MDLNFTPEESAFRQQVRSFMQEKLPADIRRKVLGGMIVERDDYVRWQRVLHEQGWGAPAWPNRSLPSSSVEASARPKATVLPEPVCAETSASLPSSSGPKTAF